MPRNGGHVDAGVGRLLLATSTAAVIMGTVLLLAETPTAQRLAVPRNVVSASGDVNAPNMDQHMQPDDDTSLEDDENSTGTYVGATCISECSPKLQHVVCNPTSGLCECEKKFPVKLNPYTGCGKPKKLGEQCYYRETCEFADPLSSCIQVQHNAVCQCKSGYHLVSLQKPSKRMFCAEDLAEMTTDFSTLAGVVSGIAVLSGLICFVLKLFNQNLYGGRHRYGNANLAPPILFSSEGDTTDPVYGSFTSGSVPTHLDRSGGAGSSRRPTVATTAGMSTSLSRTSSQRTIGSLRRPSSAPGYHYYSGDSISSYQAPPTRHKPHYHHSMSYHYKDAQLQQQQQQQEMQQQHQQNSSRAGAARAAAAILLLAYSSSSTSNPAAIDDTAVADSASRGDDDDEADDDDDDIGEDGDDDSEMADAFELTAVYGGSRMGAGRAVADAATLVATTPLSSWPWDGSVYRPSRLIGSRRPSLTSVHSGNSVRSYSMRRYEREREQKEEREMQKRLAKLQQQQQLEHQHHQQILMLQQQVTAAGGQVGRVSSRDRIAAAVVMTPAPPTPSPHSTDDLLPTLVEDQQLTHADISIAIVDEPASDIVPQADLKQAEQTSVPSTSKRYP